MRIGVAIAWSNGPFVSGTIRQVEGRVIKVAVPSHAVRRLTGELGQRGADVRLRFHHATDSSPVVRGVVESGRSLPGQRLFDVEVLDWDKLAGYWQTRQARWPVADRRPAARRN